ncbi:hypothetical protein [Williamsia phyllosphaerae]|uniref:Lipoprotein lpqE n=1 Tax=Williamsia phyllosphaerae TaxID=885042 RepID=A0ABQ1UMX3_9NOCA|nr:hypothetical protein [Williamsia phyllosphaerae]GGF21944.1 putative lipoprotein lpqE precursor [Williamsia phyllosphaerae]
MSELNPFRHLTRVAAIAAMGGALALGTTACGAGQIAQTTNQAAAVNGSFATLGDIALRDVHVVFPSSGNAAFVNGGPLELAFLISNNSPYKNDRLQSITFASGTGTVTIDGSQDIPATKTLRAGQPSQLLTSPTASTSPSSSSSESSSPSSSSSVPSSSAPSSTSSSNNSADPSETRITVTLTGAGKQITPGLTVPLVFTFAEAGKTTLNVPVDAGSVLPRDERAVQNPGGGEEEGSASEGEG